jgi:hypothetical protein
MSYDPALADRLGAFTTEKFVGEVFRATRATADPIAPSLYGGRWARPQNDDPGTSVLYTSMARDGAMAEIVSILVDLTPIPGPRELKVTRLAITASKVLRLDRRSLPTLGVAMDRYHEREYARTQEVGSTLSWLGVDGLIVPSARWQCDNLIVFSENHKIDEKLEPIDSELIEWQAWAQEHGLLKKPQSQPR